MPALSLSYFRHHIDEAIALAETGEVLIARDDGDNLLLMREAEWRSLQEIAHLLATPLNTDRLQQSLQMIRAEYLASSKTE